MTIQRATCLNDDITFGCTCSSRIASAISEWTRKLTYRLSLISVQVETSDKRLGLDQQHRHGDSRGD